MAILADRRARWWAAAIVGTMVWSTAPPARAISSVGLSRECDSYGHCVTGSAFSSNAGTDVNGGAGTAAAVCKGGANGAVLLQVTCSVGGKASTMSFPGTVGAVPVITDSATLAVTRVCWNVVGYFPNLSGEPFTVGTGGCAFVAV